MSRIFNAVAEKIHYDYSNMILTCTLQVERYIRFDMNVGYYLGGFYWKKYLIQLIVVHLPFLLRSMQIAFSLSVGDGPFFLVFFQYSCSLPIVSFKSFIVH